MPEDAKRLGYKTLANVVSGNPAGHYGALLLEAACKKFGIACKVSFVPDTGTTPEYASGFTAAGARSAEMVGLIVAKPSAINAQGKGN